MSEITAWVGISLLFASSVVGWIITYVRNTRSASTKFGNLEGKVDGLGKIAQSQQTSIDNLTARIDELMISLTKRE